MITRREEVASTRSLLNTAKLLDENQTLLKLKEMEYLEKICDKVGTITINGGKGILEQLHELTGGNEQEGSLNKKILEEALQVCYSEHRERESHRGGFPQLCFAS